MAPANGAQYATVLPSGLVSTFGSSARSSNEPWSCITTQGYYSVSPHSLRLPAPCGATDGFL